MEPDFGMGKSRPSIRASVRIGVPEPSGCGDWSRRKLVLVENPERAKASADAPSGFLASGGRVRFVSPRTSYFVLGTVVPGYVPVKRIERGTGLSHWVLGTEYWILFGVAKSGLVVAKTIERFGLRWGWGGFTLLGLAVRQLTDSAGTTERRYRAPSGRPGPSGLWSSGRRGNPERAKASADAPSGFLSRLGLASLAVLSTQYSVFSFWRLVK